MPQSFEKINAESLAAYQREVGSKLRVFCFEKTGSTNTDAARILATGTTEKDFAVIANEQSAGRGRIPGRHWVSEPGNLLLSCGFRPRELAPTRLSNFTLWLGVAVAQMLREKFGIPAEVKWPNDIFCRGKKMAGMLTEAHLDSSRVYGIIFGIGLNVNLRKESLPEELKKKTTSLCMEIDGDKALDINRVGAELLLSLEQAYARFLEGTHTFLLHQAWNALDYLYGKNVTAVFGEERLIGNASGIDEQGRILIKDTAGTLHAFSAGDVTLNTGT